VVDTTQVSATVKHIDHATRLVTLKTDDGQEYSFVVGDDVVNFAQVKKGDKVTATYTEAIAYEVRKGGRASAPTTTVAAVAAAPGVKPAGAVAEQVSATVTIAAIDTKTPSVTFRSADGGTRTIKVKYPEKLQGVKVGDTVDLSYTEAVALKVEKASK
jgi:Cu/Ag efflux protein CusF